MGHIPAPKLAGRFCTLRGDISNRVAAGLRVVEPKLHQFCGFAEFQVVSMGTLHLLELLRFGFVAELATARDENRIATITTETMIAKYKASTIR